MCQNKGHINLGMGKSIEPTEHDLRELGQYNNNKTLFEKNALKPKKPH